MGFPNFRSCDKFFGICYPQSGYSLELKKNIFTTKIYGTISFTQHQPIEGEIKRIYIKYTKLIINNPQPIPK